MAKDTFKKVRRAYSNGLKSSNKTYSPEIKTLANTFGLGPQNRDDTQRLRDAEATILAIQRQTVGNVRTGTVPTIQKKLVIDAANCGELARAAAKIATESGMHAEVWQYDKNDHAFAVIGKPPAGDSVDFADWKNVWIVDPWTGVVSEAPDYVEKVKRKMQEWHSAGKVILERAGESLAIDKNWLEAISTGTKSRVEAPSPENPNPWKYLQTAVDVRRIVDAQDQQISPIKFGEMEIRRTELFDMGAVLDGKPIGVDGIKQRTAEGLAGRLNFDEDMLKQKIRQHGENGDIKAVERIADILTEVGTHERTTALAPLLVNSKGKVDGVSAALNKQLEKWRALGSEAETSAGKSNPTTVVLPGKSAITFNNVGVGMQAFGVYSGIRGIIDAVARGDSTDAAVGAAGIGAEAAGFASEVGFTALGRSFQKGTSARLAGFAGTSVGKALGGPANIGSTISRAGGVVGGLITLPFEIYGAVTSFQNAAKSEGKVAQDHYVDGGLAVAGIGTSIAATTAGAAGLSAAGPAGLVAAGALITASRIYHAVRNVDDLGEKIDLSAWDRFETGLSTFFGGSISQSLEDRISVSDAGKAYRASKEEGATRLMENNSNYGHVVFGDPIIVPQRPTSTRTNSGWLGLPLVVTTQNPPLVNDNAASDVMDASKGVENVANAVKAPQKQGSDVLWNTGDGYDALVGVSDRSNHFLVGGGRKDIAGGQKNDVFVLNSAPDSDSVFDGGDGSDTLHMNFDRPGVRSIVRVDLSAGVLQSGKDDRSRLESIQNVVTSKNARTFVGGNNDDNVFVLNGNSDAAEGGRGSDTYVINGGGVIEVNAGSDLNRYHVADSIGRLNINSPHPDSVHELKLDFNSGDFVVRAVKNSDKLEIIFDKAGPRKKIVISGVFTRNAAGGIVPARKDGSISLITRDGLIMTPTLSLVNEYPDGLLHIGAMLAMPDAGVVSQQQA